MSRKTEAMLKQLAARRPVAASRTQELVSDDERRRTFARIVAAAEAGAADHDLGRHVPARDRRRRMPRVAGLTTAAVVVGVALAIVLSGGATPVTPHGATPALAATVNALAETAQARGRYVPLTPGQYRYTRWVGVTTASGGDVQICPNEPEFARLQVDPGTCWSSGQPYAYQWDEVSERWEAVDGSGRWLTRTGPNRLVGPRDQARYLAQKVLPAKQGVPVRGWCGQAKCLGEKPGLEETRIGAGKADYQPKSGPTSEMALRTLPTDPNELYRRLRGDIERQYGDLAGGVGDSIGQRQRQASGDVPQRGVGDQHRSEAKRATEERQGAQLDARIFEHAIELLQPAAPPELQVAVFRMLPRINGVTLVGEVTDSLGRTGIALAADAASGSLPFADGVRFEAIFDRQTGTLLAKRQVLTKQVDWVDTAPGTVLWSSAVAETGVVPTISARP
jgi:hypothetical protein